MAHMFEESLSLRNDEAGLETGGLSLLLKITKYNIGVIIMTVLIIVLIMSIVILLII